MVGPCCGALNSRNWSHCWQLKSEYIVATYAAKEALWLQALISQLFSMKLGATTLFSDNQLVIALAKEHQYHTRTKHIDIWYHFICWIIEDGKCQNTSNLLPHWGDGGWYINQGPPFDKGQTFRKWTRSCGALRRSVRSVRKSEGQCATRQVSFL